MDLKTLINPDSVMDDVNDLDAAFGYFRPLMDDDAEGDDASSDAGAPRRGRPPKDPSSAMTDVEKAKRRAMLVECYTRSKAKSS